MSANSAHVLTSKTAMQIYQQVLCYFNVALTLICFPESLSVRRNLIKNLIRFAPHHTTESYKGRSCAAILTITHSLDRPIKEFALSCWGVRSERPLRNPLWLRSSRSGARSPSPAAQKKLWRNEQATTDLEFSYYCILPVPYNSHSSDCGCFIFMAQSNPQHINKAFP